MPYGKAYRLAWRSLDTAQQAVEKFAKSIDLWNGSKLSRQDAETLCLLSAEVDRWQERIRIIQGRPLPGTASPKANRKSAGRRAREVIERPTVAPEPQRQGQTSLTSPAAESAQAPDIEPG